MNLKKFYYKDYYTHSFTDVKGKRHSISLKKSEEKKELEKISESNEPAFRDANRILTGYTLAKSASDYLDFQKQSNMAVHSFPLVTTYPGLFTGSGYTHETGSVGELKLGFFFDHTTGLPLLSGSTVKGVLRSVFPQFKKSELDPLNPVFSEDKTKAKLQKTKANFIAALFGLPEGNFAIVHRLELAIFEGVDIENTELKRTQARVENRPQPDQILSHLSMSAHDVFLDAFISKGDKNNQIIGTDALTPHGDNPLKNPIPLPFLKVLPEVTFTFQFLLKNNVLNDQTTINATRKKEVFQTILENFGAGAKTNVGYGQFKATQPIANPRSTQTNTDNVPASRLKRNDEVIGLFEKTVSGKPVFKLLNVTDLNCPVEFAGKLASEHEGKKKIF